MKILKKNLGQLEQIYKELKNKFNKAKDEKNV